MGSSDEVRRLLDERGVAWVAIAETATEYTHEGILYRAYEICDGLQVAIITPVTPEQAIAATVGAGTCHAVLDEGYYKGINGVCEGLYCSKCKEPLSRRFKHCPWCGRKIKGD